MERYEAYKDSGIEWIGEIPGSWGLVPFKRMFSHSNVGESIDKQFWSDEPTAQVFYTAGAEPIFTTFADFPVWKKTFSGDLLLARNGTPYVYLPKEGSLYTDHVIRAQIFPEFCRRYVRYCLQRSIEAAAVTTVSISTWSLSVWGEQVLPNPALAVQRAIADFLDEKTAEIDGIVSETERSIELLCEYRKSVISEAVTKGLDPDAPMKDSGVEWIGEIPEGWGKNKVIRMFRMIGSGTTPKSDNPSFFNGETPWIQSGDLGQAFLESTAKCVSELALKECSALKVYRAPFLVIAMYGGSIGSMSTSLVDACVNQACCVLSDCYGFGSYYSYVFSAAKQALVDAGIGGGQPNISQETIKSFWVPVPPVEDQKAVAAYLDAKTAEIDALIADKEKQVELLKEYRKSLISEAVTGKFKVPGVK